MSKKTTDIIKYLLLLFGIILLDQGSKLWVYNNMELGTDKILIGNFLKFTYVLNYGMAFSIQLGFKYGKLLITVVRMIVSIYIIFHIIHLYRQSAGKVWIFSWVLVLGGAIGNSIDSIFYGVYLNNAPHSAPMKWFHGQVIDMIHIYVWSGQLPDWWPIWGGYEVSFFPIFNVADVAIFVGLLIILFSYKKMEDNKEDVPLVTSGS